MTACSFVLVRLEKMKTFLQTFEKDRATVDSIKPWKEKLIGQRHNGVFRDVIAGSLVRLHGEKINRQLNKMLDH